MPTNYHRPADRICATGRLLAALEARPAGATVAELAALAQLDLRRVRLGLAALARYRMAEVERRYRVRPPGG